MKKVISLLLVLSMVFALTACGTSKDGKVNDLASSKTQSEFGEPQENKGDTLVVWSFSDEVKRVINHYLEDNPDLPYDIDVVVVPNEQYQSKLDPVLASGKSAPDIFTVEAAYVKKYVDSKYTADVATMGIDKEELDVLPYLIDVASDNDGKLKGMAFQACPGAYFYRRSIAKKYLGTDNPEEVQAMISDYDKFYDVAKKIYDNSNGEVKMISSVGDLIEPFLGSRKEGWIVDNKFTIDPKVEQLLEIGNKLESEGLINQAEQWTETWFASMSGNDVFGYFLPTWGLHYVLKENAVNASTGETTEGDWAMVEGPSPYFWGGTWYAMREGSEMEQAAADLLKYIATNEKFITEWAENTGDFVGNPTVVDSIKDDYAEPFLSGQNHYSQFAEMSKLIDASIMTGSDQDIRKLFEEQLMAYSKDEKDKETALKDFISSVQNLFPNLDY